MKKLKTRLAAIGAAALVTAALGASPAQAQISLAEVGASLAEPTVYQQAGGILHQAGAHPDFTTTVSITPGAVPSWPIESPRDIEFDLPPGLLASPTAVPVCPIKDFYVYGNGAFQTACKAESQVGVAHIKWAQGETSVVQHDAIYNLTPPADAPALLGFVVEGVPVYVKPRLRANDYGVSAATASAGQGVPVTAAKIVLWGVPADPIHNGERDPRGGEYGGGPSAAPLHPFVINPTTCPGSPVSFAGRADSWQHPGSFAEATFDHDLEGKPFVFEGCEEVPFQPSLDAQPTSHAAGAPTGLEVDVNVPQNEAPYGVSSSDVRSTTVTFPQGMTVSAASANGLGACSLEEIKLHSNEAPSCPASAKLGTVSVKSPLLEEELQGEVILAKQKENPFGSLIAMYLAIKGPGFYLKLPGRVEADPATGQLTASFADTPQLPFEELRMSLKSGPRAALVTPAACGTYTTTARIAPWSGTPAVASSSSFKIDEGCGNGSQFSPDLEAGPTDPTAGHASPFVLKVSRGEGQQSIAQIAATLPEGELAKLAGVPLCPDAQAASGACPAGSRVGSVSAAIGEGSSPLWVPEAGKAATALYLAGPYKGAPYSLVATVPAQAGPFDLGTVVVRNALHVDPTTVQVSVQSDPLPQILEGIPVSYRTVYVDVDRDGFTVNPTSCEPMQVTSTIASAQGTQAHPSAPFQVGSCASLGFKPKLALRLSGPTHRGAHPQLRATLTARKGDAAIDHVAVTLPKTEFLENAHIKTICTRVQYRADTCPAKSVYGYAKAWSPLLDKPLAGPVYLRSSDHELPDLVASLDGQIHVDLAGRIDSVHARIRDTFETVPDAPVSKFVLTMQGGDKGLLVNNTELCRTTPRADALFDAQNGRVHDIHPVAQADCRGKGAK